MLRQFAGTLKKHQKDQMKYTSINEETQGNAVELWHQQATEITPKML